MKFYYNDKLVRTSITHHYTHAVIRSDTGNVLMCSTSEEGCKKYIRRYINEKYQGIENAKKALHAFNAGQKGYFNKFGRSEYYIKFKHDDTAEKYYKWMDGCYGGINDIISNYKVVELKERA